MDGKVTSEKYLELRTSADFMCQSLEISTFLVDHGLAKPADPSLSEPRNGLTVTTVFKLAPDSPFDTSFLPAWPWIWRLLQCHHHHQLPNSHPLVHHNPTSPIPSPSPQPKNNKSESSTTPTSGKSAIQRSKPSPPAPSTAP